MLLSYFMDIIKVTKPYTTLKKVILIRACHSDLRRNLEPLVLDKDQDLSYRRDDVFMLFVANN